MEKSITIGISQCLLGEHVRFDGGHKKDNYITELLHKYFNFVPVCPEVESGMSVPRPPIHLRGDPKMPRVVEVKNPEHDHTQRLVDFSETKVKDFDNLCGFILKSKSPTCGMERVKVYQEKPKPPKLGQGIFASRLVERYPNLPVEEEGRLNDFRLRENFIERVFCYYRWKRLLSENPTAKQLIDFHSEHKLILLAHDETIYRELGHKIGNLKDVNFEEFFADYIELFMSALKKMATVKKHTNVLMHIQGYFKDKIDKEDKAELTEMIMSYRKECVPLIVPLVLLKHHLMKHPDPYLLKQRYLFPYPEQLMLRNHI